MGGRPALIGVASPVRAEFAGASVVASATSAGSLRHDPGRGDAASPSYPPACRLGPAEAILDGIDGRPDR